MTNDSAPAAPQPVKAVQLPPNPPPPPPPKGSPVGRFFRHIFSPTTRTGKFMRPLVRGLGTTVAFFALGLLACYTLLYQPLEQQYRLTKTSLEQAQTELAEKQTDLNRASLTFIGAEAERKLAVEAQSRLEGRVAVWQVMNQVTSMRLALARKDSAAAKLALADLETQLITALPMWEKLGAADAAAFQRLMDLITSDLTRDAALADQDLARLVSELMLVEQSLAP